MEMVVQKLNTVSPDVLAGGGLFDSERINDLIQGDFSSSAPVQRARELLPAVAARAQLQWQEPRITAETIAEIKDAGLFRMLQPRRFGGLEVTPIESFEATAVLSEADASVGWVLGIVGIHAFHLGFFDEQAQRDVWGSDPDVLMNSPYAPCRAHRVEGGFELTGSWSFASGSDHCTWSLLGANVEGEPLPPPGPLGRYTFLLPRTDYEIVHDWNVHGLRATGSNTIRVEGAFVPEHRSLAWESIVDGTAPGLAVNHGALFTLPFNQVFSRATQAPVALGAVKGMAMNYVDFVAEKHSRTGRSSAGNTEARNVVAAILSEVDEMKTQLYVNYARLIRQAREGRELPESEQKKFRYQSARIPARCALLATELYRVCGGTGIFENLPFGRQLADIQATQTHAINNFQARAAEWLSDAFDGAERLGQ